MTVTPKDDVAVTYTHEGISLSNFRAPELHRFVAPGGAVRTTLDLYLQREAQTILRARVAELAALDAGLAGGYVVETVVVYRPSKSRGASTGAGSGRSSRTTPSGARST